MPSLSAMIRACSACGGDYEDPDRTAATALEDDDTIVDGRETGASELVAHAEAESVGEGDRRPIGAQQAVKNTIRF
jgi:hypothetical protein